MALQAKQVLVTVMTYPSPSRRYVEIVCCAGIDLTSGSWIRLYPVPYSSLPSPNRFKKYDIIEVRCEKASRDSRIESYKVDQDSIKVIRHLDTNDNWRARRDIVLPTASSSFCEILKRVRDNKSLGMFKPCDIWRINMRSATRPNDPEPADRLLNSLRLGTLSPDPWDLPLYARSRIRGQGDVVERQRRPCPWAAAALGLLPSSALSSATARPV